MRQTKEKRDRAQNKPVGRGELGRAHDEEDARRTHDRLIPDYVMWGFAVTEKEDHDNGIRT